MMVGLREKRGCYGGTFPFRTVFVLAFGLIVSFFHSVQAQNILIFSTSHNNTEPTVLSDKEGVLKIEISTFTKIVELSINCETRLPQNSNRASIEQSYRLKKGDNRFEVFVKTEATEKRREFIITLLDKDQLERKSVKPFQMITILTGTSTSNALNNSEHEKAGTKYGYTIIPSLQVLLAEANKLKLQGVFMREKFNDGDFENEELVYNQISLGWLNKSDASDWKAEIGWENIGSIEHNGTYETEIETNTYFAGYFEIDALGQNNLTFNGKYALKDQKSDIATDDYDGDGGFLNLEIKWRQKFGNMSGYLKSGYDVNDSLGKYKDYSAAYLGLSATYAITNSFAVGCLFHSKQSAYAENDPAKGDREISTLSTATINASYTLNASGTFVFMVDATQKQKISTIDGYEYITTLANLTIIHIF